MFINGMGIVFNRGRGITVLRQALAEGGRLPALSDSGTRSFRVLDEAVRGLSVSGDLRRADRFSRMAAVAAADALRDGGTETVQQQLSIGIILATGFGPHVTTFKFLDDMLTYRERDVSPTTFSHSVHNAAVSYISLALQVRGPTLTITHFNFAFFEALLIAQTWLAEKRVSHVLAGAVDECGPVLEHIMSRKLRIAGDGRIKPFAFSSRAEAVPGEGAVFFLLGTEKSAHGYVEITDLFSSAGETSDECHVLSADGFIGDETLYQSFAAGPSMGFAALFGTMPGQLAFALASSALIAGEKQPVEVHREFSRSTESSESFSVFRCIALGCRGDVRQIRIQKTDGSNKEGGAYGV